MTRKLKRLAARSNPKGDDMRRRLNALPGKRTPFLVTVDIAFPDSCQKEYDDDFPDDYQENQDDPATANPDGPRRCGCRQCYEDRGELEALLEQAISMKLYI